MVARTDAGRAQRVKPWRWSRSPAVVLGFLASSAIAPGCGLVPKSKLDDCHRATQTLRSENVRLKSVALDLRSQNSDLSQRRAVDDAERLTLRTRRSSGSNRASPRISPTQRPRRGL